MATATLERKKAKRLWTYDELLAELPETNQPTELWDGEIIMSPSPRPDHQRIVLRACQFLIEHVLARRLGEVFISPLDVVFSPRRAAQPDLFFVSKANRGIVQDHIRGAPDLIVEVISPGTWRKDRIEKKALYEQYGVAEYWIVDPEARSIDVYALVDGAYRLHSHSQEAGVARSRLLPGFALAYAQLAA
jgi:Uma2 family endonuclease